MCGIVGYAGNVRTACGKPLEVCLQGLQRLEYRGYDSAGVALTAPGMDHVAVRKKAGRLANLVQDIERDPMPEATVGIGHTRWATNGVPNDTNAHPHTSRDGKVAIIHNGIIENASQLRLDLQTEGYHFVSETDTEVAAKLLGKISDKIIEETGKPDLFKAVRRLARMLEGAFTILATDVRQPDIVVGARHDSPLVVGLGEGENFLGSDVAAFVAYTKRAMEIDQDQAVMVSADKVVVSDFMGNIVPDPKTYTVDWDASAAEKGGWDSFMDKEIHEDPAAVQRTLLGRLDENGNINLDEVRIDEHDFKAIDKIIVIACGTAAYAGMVAKYAIEHWVRIPVEVELAHEFRYRDPILTPRTLVVAISQSGETMDTLMALRHAREQGSKVLAICNTQGASIPRESDAVLYTHAGPEVAVASTKAFVAQITAAYVLGLYLAQVKGAMYRDEIAQTLESLKDMPRKIQWILDTQTKTVQEAAEADGGCEIVPVPRPPCGLSGGHGRRVEAQGDRLHVHRGLRRGRTETWSDRAGRRGRAGRVHRAARARTQRAALQSHLRHRRGQGPWRLHHRRGRGTRSGRGTLRRRGLLASRMPDADEPAGGRGAAAAVRHGHGQAQELRRGQAAQPRQVRHR